MENKNKLRVYKTWYGRWRWQIKNTGNNEIVASSAPKGFASKQICLDNLALVHGSIDMFLFAPKMGNTN